MNKYIPFLKVKQNEIFALKSLSEDLKNIVVPFLDFPRKDGMTEQSFKTMVEKGVKSVNKNLSGFSNLYLDNYDIDDSILVDGIDNYKFIIESFSETEFVPVVALDRSSTRNQIVFDAKASGKILSDVVALRLQSEDFEEFELIAEDILELVEINDGLFSSWVLVIDNRLCLKTDVSKRCADIAKFITKCTAIHDFDQIIITGSSIPASIAEIVATETEVKLERIEVSIFQGVCNILGDAEFLTFGDYTIVSPLYSETSMPPEMMRNITAPKLVYSYENYHLILRGGALKTHSQGNLQYNDMASYLIALPFFRSESYSQGDLFIYENRTFTGKFITPTTILKPTINAHMTYMCQDFSI